MRKGQYQLILYFSVAGAILTLSYILIKSDF